MVRANVLDGKSFVVPYGTHKYIVDAIIDEGYSAPICVYHREGCVTNRSILEDLVCEFVLGLFAEIVKEVHIDRNLF